MRKPVHPRVCGEHNVWVYVSASSFGSSPRVRGTSSAMTTPAGSPRFIPACAGNIWIMRDHRVTRAVHPRVCGEHFGQHEFGGCGRGSSPRVRGTCDHTGSPLQLRRFIPACAGNIVVISLALRRLAVHPRVCGEHPFAGVDWLPTIGSSPRVRGTFQPLFIIQHHSRFIPACAGNIIGRVSERDAKTVHPRVCGEH